MHSPTTCTPMLLLLVSSMLSLSVLAISGEATFYYPEGNAGACGRVFGRNDYIAAPPPGHFSGGDSCWRCARISYGGNSVVVQVVDLCPSCHGGDLDLSPRAFNALANEGAGRIRVDWQWVDCGNRYGRSSIGRTHVEAGFGEPQNFTTPESGHNETESDTGHHRVVATVAVVDAGIHSGTAGVTASNGYIKTASFSLAMVTTIFALSMLLIM